MEFRCVLCLYNSVRKVDLLDRIRKSREEAENLIASAPADQLDCLPGPKPDWTAKDLLAHLSFWEHPTLDQLAGRSRSASWGDVPAINAELLQKSRQRSVSDVLAEFNQSGRQIAREIGELADADLARESPWNDGKTLGEHLADDTWVHYEEHLPTLRAWAARFRVS